MKFISSKSFAQKSFTRKVAGALSVVVVSALTSALTGCTYDGSGLPNLPLDPNSTPSTTPAPNPVPSSAPSVIPTPKVSPSPTPKPSPSTTTGFASCVSDDVNHQCLGVKIVSYKDSVGTPSLSQSEAVKMIAGVNDVWSPCNIAFQIDEYEAVTPGAMGLTYGAGSQSELGSIRREFGSNSMFLLTVTGPWSGSTIAWTTMPGGSGPFGTIVESDYGDNAFTVGHEFGHYMGLYHISNSSNLMNPYIGSNTQGLSTSQCSIARSTNLADWRVMFRK